MAVPSSFDADKAMSLASIDPDAKLTRMIETTPPTFVLIEQREGEMHLAEITGLKTDTNKDEVRELAVSTRL
jgi:hypothetical protein